MFDVSSNGANACIQTNHQNYCNVYSLFSLYAAIPGGAVAMVTGSYAYHHYMQDGMNDDVGCVIVAL